MKTEKRDAGRGRGALGGWVLGLVLGVALVGAPLAAGEVPAFVLAQRPPAAGTVPALPSENTAVFLSVLGSVAAVFSGYSGNGYVFLAAMGVGPSLGFFYGGCWGRGLLTATLRVAATLGMFVLAYDDDVGVNLAYIWAGAMIGSALIDVATVRSAVHRRNRAVTAGRGLKVDVAPFAMPKGGGVQVRLGF